AAPQPTPVTTPPAPQPTPPVARAAPKARVASVRWRMVARHLVVTVTVVRGSTAARGTPILLQVRKGSSVVARVAARTNVRGLVVWRSRSRLPLGRYVAKAAIRSASTA